jgi:PAS domain S-box-containing protein
VAVIAAVRILYIEDDPGLARLMQKILQRRGFVVDVASNGEDGLGMLRTAGYDLLLLDYNMPFMGGMDVIRMLSAEGSLVPTIMVTGEGNEAVAVEALKLGASDYIVKDAEMKYMDLLPSVVDQVLYRQQLVRERRQMQEAVRESEERYRLFFESNPVPTLVYELQTFRFLAVNDAAVAHYGYSRDEFLSMSVRDLYTGEEIPALLSLLAKLDQGAKQSGVWKHRLKNGALIEVEIVSHCIMIDGKRAHFILSNDITERKKMEANLLRSQKLESVGILAGGLAHDFNNLLTVILGNISLAKLDAAHGDAVYARLEEAEKATSQAQRITQQLLTFSRGGAPLKKPLFIKRLIEETAGFALRGSKSRCACTFPAGLWAVEADEGQLGQAIHNLIMNADQAMPDGGTVTVTGENVTVVDGNSMRLSEGPYVKITVADQGPGIPAEYVQKIFDPYFTTKRKGAGLGLATCYSIIKRHEGHITVESVLGAGTTFLVYLPAIDRAVPEGSDEDQLPIRGSGRILIMDDEEMVREVATRILTTMGFEVEDSSDGSEAISLYVQAKKNGKPFGAVIMDLTVPGGMGGKEAIKRLIEIDPQVKAIVSSGYSNDPIMSHFREFGFSGVVAKPYSIRTLGETIKKVMDGLSPAV